MKRRDFIKKALAVAAVAVVPFKVESEKVRYQTIKKGVSCNPTTFIDKPMRSGEIESMCIDEMDQYPIYTTRGADISKGPEDWPFVVFIGDKNIIS